MFEEGVIIIIILNTEDCLSLQEITEIHRNILTIIGYVFVPISLVFLLATIVT